MVNNPLETCKKNNRMATKKNLKVAFWVAVGLNAATRSKVNKSLFGGLKNLLGN